MRNYLKYLKETEDVFMHEYNLTRTELLFLIFIADRKKSFTKRYVRDRYPTGGKLLDKGLRKLMKEDYIFLFEKGYFGKLDSSKYRVTNKGKRFVERFYDVLEGKREL
tara:strand:+ start:805 stop:1128 length:324 start_codon:yes stop_codon:yes gene_type:complete